MSKPSKEAFSCRDDDPWRYSLLWKLAMFGIVLVFATLAVVLVFVEKVVYPVTIYTGSLVLIDPHVPFGNEILKPCQIASWNNKTTYSIPYESLHRKWAEKRKQDFSNLKGAELRVVSAFVYEHEIVVTTTAQNRYGKPVHCRYFDCNRQELPNSTWETFMFPLTAAYCARRAGAMFMSLTDSPNGLVTEPVPLTVRVQEKYTHEVAVCVGPVYGNESRWLEIAETTEHHLLIGATYFYYTIFNKMNEYTRKLVDEYERLGYFEVTVIQNEYETMNWMSHLIQINDCHFRSRYHSKWVLNFDIDERLVMLKTPLLPFLNSLSSNVGEILISTKRVMRLDPLPQKYKGKDQLLKDLEFRKYNMTQRIMWDVPKVIFRPEKVQAMFYHWSFAQYPGVQVLTLPKQDAYIRHYRTTMVSLHGIWYIGQDFNITNMDPKLEEKVTLAVIKRLESVYNQRKIRCEEIRSNLIGLFSKDMYDCVWRNGKMYRDVAKGD